MEIHLSKPGGQREGPFTLEEINASLALNKFRDTDYWAWYEGLESWVPLHEVPGITQAREPQPKSHDTEHDKLSVQGDTEFFSRKVTPSPAGTDAGPVSAAVCSGLAVEALKHIFIFTD